jgi:hypothetical protein
MVNSDGQRDERVPRPEGGVPPQLKQFDTCCRARFADHRRLDRWLAPSKGAKTPRRNSWAHFRTSQLTSLTGLTTHGYGQSSREDILVNLNEQNEKGPRR